MRAEPHGAGDRRIIRSYGQPPWSAGSAVFADSDRLGISSELGARDKHLRSADFFNVETHPQIVVEISRVTRHGDRADVTGALTAAGQSRPLTLTATISAESARAITLTASGEFDRADFGMTWGKLGMIRGKAAVTVTARFSRAQ
jgi:polyisoprenoid-binding protein YceI